jgi:hypothetical protein
MRSRTLPVLTSALAFSTLLMSLLLLLAVAVAASAATLLVPLLGRLDAAVAALEVVRGTQ